MVIDGTSLTTFQSCSRRWLLDQRWRVLRWRPKSLFDSCLRAGIFAISNGADASAVIQESRTRYLEVAANPGLDVADGGDPWTIANDYCGMLSTVLTAISRTTLLTVSRVPSVRLTEELSWLPVSWADESGVLHRWITVDKFDDSVLCREAHGWRIFGDMAVCNAPLTLHIVEIGQQRGGRRQSPWVRAFKHPVIAGRYKFQRKDGLGGHRPLSGAEWKPMWYADQPRPDPATWVDMMDADAITPSLLYHPAIAQPSRESASQARIQIEREGRRMLELSRLLGDAGGMSLPMSRGACDGWVPCPFQQACYREQPAIGIPELGLYQLRRSEEAAS